MVTDLGCLQPSMKVILSSAILRSSTKAASPRSFDVKASMLLTMFPPVALAKRSMSDFLALRIAATPFLERKCWTMSSMPFWQMTTFAPAATSLSAMAFKHVFFLVEESFNLVRAFNVKLSVVLGFLNFQ